MTDPRAWGLWCRQPEGWLRSTEGLIIVYYTQGAAVADLRQLRGGDGGGEQYIEVREIGHHGWPVPDGARPDPWSRLRQHAGHALDAWTFRGSSADAQALLTALSRGTWR